MRTTLQTVPESLPADHVTNTPSTSSSTTPQQTTGTAEIKNHTHTNTSALKTRSSTTKVGPVSNFFLNKNK